MKMLWFKKGGLLNARPTYVMRNENEEVYSIFLQRWLNVSSCMKLYLYGTWPVVIINCEINL